MLSLTSKFDDMDIVNVQVLRSGTVYLLTGQADEKLVVKVEPNNLFAPTFGHAKVAMKAVDANAGKVKALVASEIKALEDWAEFIKRITEDFNENKLNSMGLHPGASDLLLRVKDGKNSLWYKMPLADLTDADKLLSQRLGTGGSPADKTVMAMFVDGLNAVGGIEQIGRIIAADMYTSNQDRFSPRGGCQKTYGTKTVTFKTIVNPGNVFVIGKDTQQRISFSGHDFIDPNTGYKDYSNSLADIKEGYNEDWLGATLCSKSERRKFAKRVVHDLETIVSPNRKALSPFRKLSSKADTRLERGMVDGMRLIVAAIAAKYNKAGAKWPAGVKERYDKFSAALK